MNFVYINHYRKLGFIGPGLRLRVEDDEEEVEKDKKKKENLAAKKKLVKKNSTLYRLATPSPPSQSPKLPQPSVKLRTRSTRTAQQLKQEQVYRMSRK